MFINLNRFKTSSVAKAISSLFLDFTATNTLDDRVTFSRTSNATVTRSDGTIGYAPHNLLTFSEQFDNAAWGKNGGCFVTSNITTAPNNTITADKLIFPVGLSYDSGTTAGISQTPAGNYLPSTVYTISVYVKASEITQIAFRSNWSGGTATYNLTTEVANFNYGLISASIENANNGWYRCICVFTSGASGNNGISIKPYIAGGTGDGTSGVFIWGAQLELGSTATTYNPTTVKNLLGFSELFDNAAWTKSNSFVQTNLLNYSEDFSNAAWIKDNSGALSPVVTANQAIAPNGTNTADRIVFNKTGGLFSRVTQTPSATSGITYTFSVWLKVATGSTSNLGIRLNATGVNCVVTTEWARFTISAAATSNAIDGQILLFDTITGNDEISDVYVWGAQLVQGSVAGDYRRTDAAALPVYYPNHNGVVVAEKLVEDTTTTAHGISQIVTGTAFIPYTYSIYAKKGERTKFAIWLRGVSSGNRVQAGFDLNNGTYFDSLTVGNFTNGSATITPVGNGWYRCSVTGTTGSGETSIRGLPYLLDNASSPSAFSYTGDGTSGIYIFGAQLSDSASLDPYVLTAAAAPTAAAYYGPRFDYDPVTLQPKGLLIEEQRVNLVLQSETLGTTWILASSVLTQNTDISPDGTQDADKLIANNAVAVNTILLYQEVSSLSAATAYTGSVYFKSSNQTSATISMAARDSGGGLITRMNCTYDLSTNTSNLYATGTFTNTSATISSVGNGWYRCTLTGITPALTQRIRFELSNAVIGDGVNGFLAWGAQLEAGAFATSYIPTVASQVTRTADVATIQGSNFYSWYNQNEGSVYSNSNTFSPANTTCIISINDNTNNNRIQIAITSTSNILRDYIIANSIEQFGIIYSPPLTSANAKQCTAYAVNSFAASINNSPVQIDNLGITPIVNRTSLGFGDGQYLNGTIKQISYYPIRLADTVLQGLTT